MLCDIKTGESKYARSTSIYFTNPFTTYVGSWRRVSNDIMFDVKTVNHRDRKTISKAVITKAIDRAIPPFNLMCEEDESLTQKYRDEIKAVLKKTYTRSTHIQGTTKALQWLKMIMNGVFMDRRYYEMAVIYGAYKYSKFTGVHKKEFVRSKPIALAYKPLDHPLYRPAHKCGGSIAVSKLASIARNLRVNKRQIIYIGEDIETKALREMMKYNSFVVQFGYGRAITHAETYPGLRTFLNSTQIDTHDVNMRDTTKCGSYIEDKILVGGEITRSLYKDVYYGGMVSELKTTVRGKRVVLFMDVDLNWGCVQDFVRVNDVDAMTILYDSNIVYKKGTFQYAFAQTHVSRRVLMRCEQRFVSSEIVKKQSHTRECRWLPDKKHKWAVNQTLLYAWGRQKYKKWPIHSSLSMMTLDRDCFPALPKWNAAEHDTYAPYALVIVENKVYRDQWVCTLTMGDPWRKQLILPHEQHWATAQHVLCVCDRSNRSVIYTALSIPTRSTTFVIMKPVTKSNKRLRS